MGQFRVGHTQQVFYVYPRIHLQNTLLVMLKVYAYLCICVIVTDNYYR